MEVRERGEGLEVRERHGGEREVEDMEVRERYG